VKLRKINDEVPTKVLNVMSSTAGAGSSEFHIYRNYRRKEQDRVKKMEADAARSEVEEGFRARREAAAKEAEERAAKKRLKRQKKKGKKRARADGGAGGGRGGSDDGSDSGSDGPGQAALD
jgi:predicted RNA-binding protein with RPS1 domain